MSWLMLSAWLTWPSLVQGAAPVPTPQHYAILIGANDGHADEASLFFAHDDARQMRQVLAQLGGFADSDVQVLLQPSEARLREAFASVGQGLRQHPHQGFLLVYFSGHGDASSMHLGEHDVTWKSLMALTQNCAARTSLMVLDSCRSGGLTQVKGAHAAPAFELASRDGTLPEGLAILTSASAGENAQESAAWGGSLFTHHLLSGLRGAADRNHDDRVTLSEVFDYASEHTLAASGNTVTGVQHATFDYKLHGRADLTLTLLGNSLELQRLDIPRGATAWLRRGGPSGPLMAEASAPVDETRSIWVAKAGYYVLVRKGSQVHVGMVPADAAVVDLDTLPTQGNAPLLATAPKGGPMFPAPWALQGMATLGLAAPIGQFSWPLGGGAMVTYGYSTHLWFDVSLQVAVASNQQPTSSTTLLTGAVAAGPRFGLTLGPILTGSAAVRVAAQAVQERLAAQVLTQLQPQLQAVVRLDGKLSDAFFVFLEGLATLSLATLDNQFSLQWAPGLALGVGYRF